MSQSKRFKSCHCQCDKLAANLFTSEISWTDHHGSGLERIAGSSEVMPLNAIEFADVVTHGVVDPIEV